MRDAFAQQTLSRVPLFGKSLTAGYELLLGRGWGYGSGGAIEAPITGAASGIRKLFDDKPENNGRGIWDLAEGVNLISPAPFPVTAIRRVVNAGHDAAAGGDWDEIARDLVGMRRERPGGKKKALPRKRF